MALSRLTTAEDRYALKIATQRTVHMCGGQESAASITRVGRQTLSDYGNTGNPRLEDSFIPLDVLADFIKDCAERGEVAPVLQWLNAMAGGRFVPLRGNGKLEIVDGMLRDLLALREQLQDGEGEE